MSLGQYKQAIQDLDEAIRLDPQHEAAYSNSGKAYSNLGEQELADRDFAKAKELGYDPLAILPPEAGLCGTIAAYRLSETLLVFGTTEGYIFIHPAVDTPF